MHPLMLAAFNPVLFMIGGLYMNNNKVHYTKKDTYIVYDNKSTVVNYIIIGISVLAITLTGIAYSVSLRSNAAEELSSVSEPTVSVMEEFESEIL